MALVTPNAESLPAFPAQAVLDATDVAALSSAIDGSGVISGCQVSAQSTPNMTVQVAAGSVYVNGATVSVAAVASLAIAAASAGDRRDIVTVNSSGAVSVTTGTASTVAGWTATSTGAPPVKPAIPAGSVLLGEVYVAASTTSIGASNLTDKTTTVSAPPLTAIGGTISANVTINTTSTLVFNTASLAVGTWLVTVNTNVVGVTTGQPYQIELVAGTATCTFAGPQYGGGYAHGTTSDPGNAVITCLVTVTAAGTLAVNAIASASTCTALATGDVLAVPATGYTAVMVG